MDNRDKKKELSLLQKLGKSKFKNHIKSKNLFQFAAVSMESSVVWRDFSTGTGVWWPPTPRLPSSSVWWPRYVAAWACSGSTKRATLPLSWFRSTPSSGKILTG